MKRRQVHHTSTSNDFHAALFVDEYPRPSIDVCTIGNSPTLHKNLAQPSLSVQLWVSKLSKSCQHFLNLRVKEKQLWQVNVLSPRMPLYGTLSLFRTSFAGCYAFPCISLGCDVSTCKPYWMPAHVAVRRQVTATIKTEIALGTHWRDWVEFQPKSNSTFNSLFDFHSPGESKTLSTVHVSTLRLLNSSRLEISTVSWAENIELLYFSVKFVKS